MEYVLVSDLLLGNTCFKICHNHLIMYISGNATSQIDFILFHKSMHKFISAVKVIPGEEVVLQHWPLVCDMKIIILPLAKYRF